MSVLRRIALLALILMPTLHGGAWAQQSLQNATPIAIQGVQITKPPIRIRDLAKTELVGTCHYDSSCTNGCKSCYPAGCGCSSCCVGLSPQSTIEE